MTSALATIRKRVSAIVVHNGQVLAFHAQDPHSGKRYVFLPGGLIEAGESPENTAIRETKEETGYDIDIDSDFRHFERYDFEWNGQINDCATTFFVGRLNPPEQAPSIVSDAPYHQGVTWVSFQDIEADFNYHDSILRPIKRVVGEFLLTRDSIDYFKNRSVEVATVARLYESSGINRPISDLPRLRKMYENSNLVVSAWKGDQLVGIARSVTDFSYCCYLSDLAVQKEHQKAGIGKTLMQLTKQIVGPQSMLLLLSAPNAMEYYPHTGFESVKNGFIIKRER